jgi:RHS repeat-associated protein
VQTRLTWPDGGYAGYTLDSLNRMTDLGGNANSGLIHWIFDNLGRPASLVRGASGVGGTTSYGYDNLGRLTSMTNDLAGTAYDIGWSFAYSPAGQLTTTTASSTVYDYKETAASTVGQTYDGLNRDAAINALSGGYDANGNLGNDGTRLFYYDVYNRLTGVGSSAYPNNGPYLTFAYDPLGRLSSQTYYGTTTSFLYDGTNLIGEYDGSGTVLRRYAFGPGTDQPLFWNEAANGGSNRYFYSDYHGSIIGYGDASGNLQALYKYGPYGEPKDINNGTNFSGARFRYTGQMVLPEASLYDYKARVYDPIMGHFLQTDPIGSKADLDLYAYVTDDPIDHGDPTGECEPFCGALIGAAVGGGIEVLKETVIEHKDFQHLDGGAILRETVIGGIAGGTGAGIGALATKVGGVVVGAVVAGGVTAGTSSALHGDKPADVAINATIGAVTGGVSKYVGGKTSSALNQMGERTTGNPIQVGSALNKKNADLVGKAVTSAVKPVGSAILKQDCKAAGHCGG